MVYNYDRDLHKQGKLSDNMYFDKCVSAIQEAWSPYDNRIYQISKLSS